jgi:hypothetical protein
MFLLDPFTHVLAGCSESAHAGLTALGFDSHAGLTWLLCIASVVAVVRAALLPSSCMQLPFWFALYRLVSQVAAGSTVGAMSVGLFASLAGRPCSAFGLPSDTSVPASAPPPVRRARRHCRRPVLRDAKALRQPEHGAGRDA